MKDNLKSKKYFIKDESLHNSDADKFNYSDISKVLNDIIETNAPPYNVAIIGKWGLGKSSLINLVTDRYKKESDKYIVQEINAWKYEKESLRKVFLKQLWQGISNQRVQSFEVIRREIANVINNDIEDQPKPKEKGRTWKFIFVLALIVLFTILFFCIYKLVQAEIANNNPWNWTFWGNVFLSYCKNIGTILFLPVLVALFKLVIDDYHSKQTKKIELNFPIETTDDYEIFLEAKIKEKLEKHSDLKIVTVIDDLDRLSIDKIVEALDALKAFVGFNRCIFIVPFDDEIIKCALTRRRAKEFNEQDDVIESELILDKLFQFKIYLPPILDFDIKKYALQLANQEAIDFINEYCPKEIMERAINRIIIHNGVTTPRQVKKLLNAFINNFMVAYTRENSGKIQKGLLTSESGTMQIAKLSVLQADFNEFFDLLFKDMRCIEQILDCHNSSQTIIPEHLLKFFVKETGKIKGEYESLINFLIKTQKYETNNIAPYLFLAQDDINIKLGDELQRRATNALYSGNISTLKELLQESESISDAIVYCISSNNDDVNTAIASAINVFDEVPSGQKSIMAQNIIERIIEIDSNDHVFLYDVNPENIFSIVDHAEKEEFNDKFLNSYISVFLIESWIKEDYLIRAVKSMISHFDELKKETKDLIHKLIKNCINVFNISVETLVPCVEATPSKTFVELWGMDWYNKLIKHIEEDNDFSDNTIHQLRSTFKALKSQYDVDILVDKLVSLCEYSALLHIIGEILENDCELTGERIKEVLSEKTATIIAEKALAHDIEEQGEVICSLLAVLPYSITKENAELFDKFTLNFDKHKNIDGILIYCGQKQYLEFLPNTISKLTEIVHTEDTYDSLIVAILPFFNQVQKDAFFQKLKNLSVFQSGKAYNRECIIYEFVSQFDFCAEYAEDIVKNTLFSQFEARYNQPNYFSFVATTIGILKNSLFQSTIDLYVDKLLSKSSLSIVQFLDAIRLIPLKMSEEKYSKIFNKIIGSANTSEFELALNIIIDNDKLRPKESTDLSNYMNFLVNNLSTAENPNRILKRLSVSFSRINRIKDMISNSLQNNRCEEKVLCETTGHLLDGYETIGEVVTVLLDVYSINNANVIVEKSIVNTVKYKAIDIVKELCDSVSESTSSDVIMNLVSLACKNIKTKSGKELLLKCLEITIGQINQSQNSIKIISEINYNKEYLVDYKKELADILRIGFSLTNSDSLKSSILNLVSSFKIKNMFKKGLIGDALDYYKSWIH